ncbi:MAG: ATP-binding protein [Desulfobacula sp.]|jgi:anti-sigma regulatory factor (Ser/Thr protein kinase)|nr:ATP-binding protein [Desulfobacula sp.]
MKKKSFVPQTNTVNEIQEFVGHTLMKNKISSKKIASLELIIEEIITNIVNYGFKVKSNGVIDIGVDFLNHDMLIEINDNGIAFNPLEKKDPDVDARIDDRSIGGLGIFLVKQLAKKVDYSRENDKNNLSIIFDIIKET